MENDAAQTSEVSKYQLISQSKLDKFQLQSGNLARWSMRLWHVFLTQHQALTTSLSSYQRSSVSSAAASSHCCTGVWKFSQQFIQSTQTPTFIRKLFNKFFAP